MYRYNFAMYVHDIDRQIREFSVPIADSANVAAMGFRDLDGTGANDWAPVRGNGKITWSTQTFAENQNANSLKYGNVFNFWIDCNVVPADGMGSIGLYKPGTLPCLTVVGRMPGSTFFPTSYTIVDGDLISGDQCDLFYDEGDHMVIGNGESQRAVVEFKSTAPATTPVMKFQLDSRVTRSGLSLVIDMYNYAEGKWISVYGGVATPADNLTTSQVATPAAFIKADKEVKARVSFGPINDEDPAQDGWTHEIDMARWKFQNF